MQVTKTVEETRKQIKQWKKEGKTIGLVPTMGFLHEGHASLIRKCREQNDIVVVSDFVNPTQFGPNEDLEAYPRDFERDSKLCESLGADLIFAPSPEDMYHDPHAFVSIDTLSETLCGKTRPIHFKGVCTVVTKLFHIVAPDRAYFGEKMCIRDRLYAARLQLTKVCGREREKNSGQRILWKQYSVFQNGIRKHF